ncbi:hypothetical protein J3458_002049 [Metarhizium acridum]|uniref:uncharacterized protein n=1 Tax=Metarhizium acridum TaxID=92637 RepID=UPI001C6AB973|nr:hypothetical protein J3458_002049 [Metarhizium acridum]
MEDRGSQTDLLGMEAKLPTITPYLHDELKVPDICSLVVIWSTGEAALKLASGMSQNMTMTLIGDDGVIVLVCSAEANGHWNKTASSTQPSVDDAFPPQVFAQLGLVQ